MTINPFVSCYVLRRVGTEHEVLQLLRRPGVYMGETWQAVSGAIEADESAWQAALRELSEETGLVAVNFYRLPSVHTFYIPELDRLSCSICFCAIVSADEDVVLNDEHTDHKWIPLADASEHFMWPSDYSALDEIRNYVLESGLCSAFLPIASSTR
jgi:dATP pyrophosphohydrolase